jgi:replicative DNA helicase
MAVSTQSSEYPEWDIKSLSERAADRWQKKIVARKTYHLGIPCVDEIVKVRAGNMVYIVAPPKTGKTWLQSSIASFLSNGNKVYFVSAEMHPDDIYTRISSHISGVDLTSLDYLDDLKNSTRQLMTWGNNLDRIMQKKLTICKARGMSFGTVKSRIISAIQQGHEIIMIDYLQRIKGPGADKRIETMEMSRELTDMAGKYEKLFIVASQASRAARAAGRTQAHHAKESAAIEEDADVVLSLTSKEDYDMSNSIPLMVDVFQRSGVSSIIYLDFNPTTGQYSRGKKWEE